MNNPINISGKEGEKSLGNFLKSKNIPYKSGGSKTIDYTIFLENKTVYVECTNQNVEGSVMEKLPHKIWKYHQRIGFKEVIIQRGNLELGKGVMSHIRDIESQKGIRVMIMNSNELQQYLLDVPVKTHEFFDFKTTN